MSKHQLFDSLNRPGHEETYFS